MSHAILVIDDEEANLVLLEEYLEGQDFETTCFSRAKDALAHLESGARVEAILLDRMMPEMDGMQFLATLKSHDKFQHIPVIMQTAAAAPEQVQQGIEAGVFHYITKPFSKSLLLAIVHKALRDYAVAQRLEETLGDYLATLACMQHCSFRLQRLADVTRVARYLSAFYPKPNAAMIGIKELILNALEHGNLGIHYQCKSQFADSEAWETEVNHRALLPQNSAKWVQITLAITPDELILTVSDEGSGFDWRPYLTLSTERAYDTHGRGIALAKAISFDVMEYVAPGNKVVCRNHR